MKKRAYQSIITVIMALCFMIIIVGCQKGKKQPEVSQGKNFEDDAYDEDHEYDDNVDEENEKSGKMYRIRVVDESMDPVEGAMVQFCSDETCKMGMTDNDGIATFSDPPGEYEVHVQKLPEGYKKHTTAYKTEKQYSDMVIVVERE